MEIIHHNQAFDVDAFFARLKSSYIGIDADDYKTFLTKGNEVHTFIRESDEEGRVLIAIGNAIGSDEAKAVISGSDGYSPLQRKL